MVGEGEDAGFNGGVAVEEDIGGIEAVEDEIKGGYGAEKKGEREEKNWEFQSGHGRSREETEEDEEKGTRLEMGRILLVNY